MELYLIKEGQKGGSQWKPTSYRNSVQATMDCFDLMDIQRTRHPRINKYSYTSKALGVRSRIYFFLIAKQLTQFVKKVDIQTSIAPDHSAIVLLSWPNETPRGPGYRKFNNTLVEDEEYVSKIRELYPCLREKYAYLNDPQLF